MAVARKAQKCPYVSESFRSWLTEELAKAKKELDDDMAKPNSNATIIGRIRGKYFALKMVLDQIRNVC